MPADNQVTLLKVLQTNKKKNKKKNNKIPSLATKCLNLIESILQP